MNSHAQAFRRHRKVATNPVGGDDTNVASISGFPIGSNSMSDDRFTAPRTNPPQNSENPISEIVVSGTVQFLDFFALVVAAIVAYGFYVYLHLGYGGFFFFFSFTPPRGAVALFFLLW